MIEQLLRAPGHTFTVAGGEGWADRDLARLLRANGIACWGFDLDAGGDWLVTVPKAEAAHAQQVLERALVVLIGGGLQPGQARRRLQGRSRLWRLL